MSYIINPFANMFDFKGKSKPKDFWIFFLFLNILAVLIGFISSATNFENLRTIFSIIILIPLYAIGFRRLNDAGIVKWLFLIPLVNLILAAMPSKERI